MTENHGAVGFGRNCHGSGKHRCAVAILSTKEKERVTLQVRGEGPLGNITSDAASDGTLRTMIRTPAATPGTPIPMARVSLGAAVGPSGVLSVVREVGAKDRFGGQVPLEDGEIDHDTEVYLRTANKFQVSLHVKRCWERR